MTPAVKELPAVCAELLTVGLLLFSAGFKLSIRGLLVVEHHAHVKEENNVFFCKDYRMFQLINLKKMRFYYRSVVS